METARALGLADLKAARRDVQIVTKSTKAPGARLHVLTIGISDYGDKARNLRLNFAARDAQASSQRGDLFNVFRAGGWVTVRTSASAILLPVQLLHFMLFCRRMRISGCCHEIRRLRRLRID